MRTTWTLAIGVLAASCMAPDPSTESVSRPIVAGALDPGDPAMVEFFAIQANSLSKCTATLVSPRVLLTAAHCIFETQGARYRVFLGNDDSNVTAKDLLPVASAAFDPMYNNSNPALGHDIGVVVLATPLTIPIVPINRAPLPSTAVGQPARYVGYGLTDGVAQSGDGRKRDASAPIAQVGRALIRIAKNAHGTCNGDSGGPLLMDTGSGEAIIGVVSFGNDATCRTDSFFQRIDTQVAFVDQQIMMHDPGASVPADGGRPAGDARPGDASAPDVSPDLAPPDLAPPLPPDAAPLPPDATADLAATPSPPTPPPDAGQTPAPNPLKAQNLSGGCTCALDRDVRPGRAAAVLLGLLVAGVRRRRKR